jgi:hypothetical protein
MGCSVRTLILTAACVLVGCANERLPPKDDWVILRSTATPREIVLVRERLPTEAVRAKYPVLLRITWVFESSTADGLPTEAESERGKQISTVLEQLIERDGVFAMSRTVAGARSMYYYVKQPTAHSEDLRRYFDSMPPIHVRITARDEPGWDSMRKVLDGIRN